MVLQAVGRSTFDGVRFQFRKGAAEPLGWQDVNPANVKKQDGTSLPNWTAGSVAFTTVGQVKTTESLTWDAFTQLGTDAAIDIRAEFTTGGTGAADTIPVTFTLDRRASSAATEQVGPGSVNLLNGDLSLSATDTSMFGASVSRSANSLFPTQATSTTLAQPFGPAWATGMESSIGSDYTAIKIPNASETQLLLTDGSSVWFYRVRFHSHWLDD